MQYLCANRTNAKPITISGLHILPVKEKKAARKQRWFYYLVVENKEQVFIRKRGAGDIWENLYEFVLHEQPAEWQNPTALIDEMLLALGIENCILDSKISHPYRQLLTHQVIHGQFIHRQIVRYNNRNKRLSETYPLHHFSTMHFQNLIKSWLEQI